jgi:hypothetical protein
LFDKDPIYEKYWENLYKLRERKIREKQQAYLANQKLLFKESYNLGGHHQVHGSTSASPPPYHHFAVSQKENIPPMGQV